MTDRLLHHYFVYGLQLECSDPLSGLPNVILRPTPDVRIIEGMLPAGLEADSTIWQPQSRYNDSRVDADGNQIQQIRVSADGRFIQFIIRHTAVVVFDFDGTAMWIDWGLLIDYGVREFNILGPLLGFLLHLRGLIPIHASAVDIGGSAIMFIGVSGAGKSTTAAAFARQGYPILADDICTLHIIDGLAYLAPGPAHVRLLPDAADALSVDQSSLIMQTRGKEKHHVVFNTYAGKAPLSLDSVLVPLGRVYRLRDREQQARIVALPQSAALLIALGSVYENFIVGVGIQKRAMGELTQVVRRVPFFDLYPPQRHDQLSRMIALIVGE